MTDQADFALDLHRVAVPDPSQNACWSPFSVACALALAREGARGRTRAELDVLLSGFELGAALEVPELALAAMLWADDGLALNPGFPLASSVRRTAFSDHRTARELINAAVGEATRGLVPELLGHVSPATVAVLVNALYLKVSWQRPFKANATKPRLFHAPGGDVEVPTMEVAARLGHAHRNGWRTVVLPARSGVEVLVLLPDESLDQPLGASAFDVDDSAGITLLLPKVDVREKFELSDVLERVGVGTMFSAGADFTGLSPDHLVVSEVVHEAVLRVDERGLEGAAATAVVMTRGARSRPPVDPVLVHVDRPFLLVVRHAESKAVYFLAQVAHP